MTKSQKDALQQALGEPDYDEVVGCICENFEPDQVFDTEALEAWANQNGFVKAE